MIATIEFLELIKITSNVCGNESILVHMIKAINQNNDPGNITDHILFN